MNESKTQVIAPEKVNKDTVGQLSIHASHGAHKLMPESMAQAMEVAKMMSISGVAVPPGLRNNAGACLSVAMKAWNWGMEPYSVASKCYVVTQKGGVETLAYEAQLVHAVVNARAPLQKRLRVTYDGEGPAMTCTVTGHLDDEEEPFVYTTPPVTNIGVQNSPLWKNDTKQQLGYYAVRAWARKFVPEVILGVYTRDEIEDVNQRDPNKARDITPRPEEPEYIEHEEAEEEPADFEMVSQFGEEIGTYTAKDFAAKLAEEAERLIQIGVDQPTFQQFMDNNYEVQAQLPDDLRKETGEFLMEMFEGLRPEPEPEDDKPETKDETTDTEPATDGEMSATVDEDGILQDPADQEPEFEIEVKTEAGSVNKEPEPEPEFIEWWTPSGAWKFRNTKELLAYIGKLVKSEDMPLENFRDTLVNNADLLAKLTDVDGEAVEQIKSLLGEKITEMESEK